ncbi:LAFE_0G06722g1_1 [Lachancea fermentati]|uniref:LAFE_0G06722g1_1 n=1 Tax=Lachancea fermentati TaxID=4955 RepID=A0A1G4MH72_LACFM|nr:LAFE_0G06722g1_1 [Lachancea fermentati]
MLSISTEIEINCAPSQVRATLLDFDNHPQWNPFFQSIRVLKGDPSDIKQGDQLEVIMQSSGGGSPMTFKPTVLRNDAERFEWKGVLWSDWIFAGKHSFEFIDLDGGQRTRLIQSEQFTGSLMFALKYFLRDTPKDFDALNAALKETCEK